MDLGSSYSGVEDVADYCNAQVVEFLFVLADGEHVQHGLGRVRVPPVTCINNRDMWGNMVCNEKCGPTMRVTYDKKISVHRFQGFDGIQDRLTLAGRQARGIEVYHICRQALGRDSNVVLVRVLFSKTG